MKTDIDIQDDILNFLAGNEEFLSEISAHGFAKESIVIEKRKESAEQIVISILANGGATELQDAYVNVNVFVKDKKGTEQTDGAGEVTVYYADRKRLRPICEIMQRYLSSGYGDTFRFDLDSQRVLEDAPTHTHFVNNKLLYHQINM